MPIYVHTQYSTYISNHCLSTHAWSVWVTLLAEHSNTQCLHFTVAELLPVTHKLTSKWIYLLTVAKQFVSIFLRTTSEHVEKMNASSFVSV